MSGVDGQVSKSSYRRLQKWLWLNQHAQRIGNISVYTGRPQDIPLLGVTVSQHYHDLDTLRKKKHIKMLRRCANGPIHGIGLMDRPLLHHRHMRNTTASVGETEPLAGDSGRRGRMERTAAIHRWLITQMMGGIWDGNEYDIPQSDMALGTVREHLKRLRDLGYLRKLKTGSFGRKPEWVVMPGPTHSHS